MRLPAFNPHPNEASFEMRRPEQTTANLVTPMDATKTRAYLIVLAQGLLHLKWDLACLLGGLSWWPPHAIGQLRAARRAALRAYALHNLAIRSTFDFTGFSEEQFWADIEKFQRDCPGALCPYRTVFELCLRGEAVNIVAPSGVGET